MVEVRVVVTVDRMTDSGGCGCGEEGVETAT
jgi:hypothetical protein